MKQVIRIGTRDSELARWQAFTVKDLLAKNGWQSELVYIKSEGDIDLKTPLYEMGVQGIFTRSLDIALLNNRIDIAVHSMKDVPTMLPVNIIQASVLPRGPVHDLLVLKDDASFLDKPDYIANIATSSIRRKAQWLHRFPQHQVHNLRGNVNTRLKKLQSEYWDAAIFALAGLERINLRPPNSIILDWMLPAPSQGAIIVVCREDDKTVFDACQQFSDQQTATCTNIEKDFLRELAGGCSTPISALAEMSDGFIHFRGNIFSLDGHEHAEIEKKIALADVKDAGKKAAIELLKTGGQEIADKIQHAV